MNFNEKPSEITNCPDCITAVQTLDSIRKKALTSKQNPEQLDFAETQADRDLLVNLNSNPEELLQIIDAYIRQKLENPSEHDLSVWSGMYLNGKRKQNEFKEIITTYLEYPEKIENLDKIRKVATTANQIQDDTERAEFIKDQLQKRQIQGVSLVLDLDGNITTENIQHNVDKRPATVYEVDIRNQDLTPIQKEIILVALHSTLIQNPIKELQEIIQNAYYQSGYQSPMLEGSQELVALCLDTEIKLIPTTRNVHLTALGMMDFLHGNNFPEAIISAGEGGDYISDDKTLIALNEALEGRLPIISDNEHTEIITNLDKTSISREFGAKDYAVFAARKDHKLTTSLRQRDVPHIQNSTQEGVKPLLTFLEKIYR